MTSMKVDVPTNSPILRMEVSVDDFGKMFSHMNSADQIAVIESMVNHMKPHATQWDFIATDLEGERHADLRRDLRDIVQSFMGLDE